MSENTLNQIINSCQGVFYKNLPGIFQNLAAKFFKRPNSKFHAPKLVARCVNVLTGDTRKIFVSNIQDRRRVSLGARLDRL